MESVVWLSCLGLGHSKNENLIYRIRQGRTDWKFKPRDQLETDRQCSPIADRSGILFYLCYGVLSSKLKFVAVWNNGRPQALSMWKKGPKQMRRITKICVRTVSWCELTSLLQSFVKKRKTLLLIYDFWYKIDLVVFEHLLKTWANKPLCWSVYIASLVCR